MRQAEKIKKIIEVSREVLDILKNFYGDRLLSLAIFGSVAREKIRKDSDVDYLVILEDPLPTYGKRIKEFMLIWKDIIDVWDREFPKDDISPYFLILSRKEAESHPSLFLDMTQEVMILFDRDNFLKRELDRMRAKMSRWGSRRVFTPHGWYWVIKPGLQPGEKFKL